MVIMEKNFFESTLKTSIKQDMLTSLRNCFFKAAPHDVSLARRVMKIIATKARRHKGFIYI